jgi:hypothetical protein
VAIAGNPRPGEFGANESRPTAPVTDIAPIMDEVKIMQLAVHQFLSGMREALAIWLALIGFTAAIVSCMLVPGRIRQRAQALAARRHQRQGDPQRQRVSRHPSQSRRPVPTGAVGSATAAATRSGTAAAAGGAATARAATAARGRREAPATQAEDLVRYAGEIEVAAGRAGVTAERRHREWLAAQHDLDEAWRAYEVAEAAARRVLLAAAFDLPETPGTPDEFAARERYLHRAATDAYRRGDLAAEQVADALAHRNGWDARLHPFEQDVRVRRAAQHRTLRIYQAAVAAERAARYADELAAAARRSLDAEASAAAVRAWQAGEPSGGGAAARLGSWRARRSRPGLAPRTTLATR